MNNVIRKTSPVTIGIGLIAIVLLQPSLREGIKNYELKIENEVGYNFNLINNSESVNLKTIENTAENTQPIFNSEFSISDSDLRSAVRPRWEVELEAQMYEELKAPLPQTITPAMLVMVSEVEAALVAENNIAQMLSDTDESVQELHNRLSLEDPAELIETMLLMTESPAVPQPDDSRHVLEERTRFTASNLRGKLLLWTIRAAGESLTISVIIQTLPVLYLYSALLIIILIYHSIRQGYGRSRAGARNLKFKIKNVKLVNVFHKLKFILVNSFLRIISHNKSKVLNRLTVRFRNSRKARTPSYSNHKSKIRPQTGLSHASAGL